MASFYLKRRNQGVCNKLCGSVLLYFVLMNDKNHKWTQEMKELFEIQIKSSIRALRAQARQYIPFLSMLYVCHEESFDEELDKIEITDLMKKYSDISVKTITDTYMQHRYDSVAVVYVYPFKKRGSAVCSKSDCLCDEYACVSYEAKDSTIIHEILHLYGAIDLYYPKKVKQMADIYLGPSYMGSGNKVDSFNAYMIGWMDDLNEVAFAFYEAIKDVTYEEYVKALDEQWGKAKDKKEVKEVKEVLGRNGYHEYKDKCGNIYKGHWVNNKREGHGRCEYHDGTVYDGNYENDQINGYGVMMYKIGSIYLGNWVNGKCQGYGVYIYENGDIYDGNFENHRFEGYGTMYYKNKKVVKGYWKNGNLVKQET